MNEQDEDPRVVSLRASHTAVYQHVRDCGHLSTRRYKIIDFDEANDCVQGFVVHMHAIEDKWLAWYLIPPSPEAWLRTCAHHWTLSWICRLRRLRAHEVPLSVRACVNGILLTRDLPDHTTDPGTILLRGEIWRYLWEAVELLSSAQRKLFIAFYIDGNSAVEIATEWGKKPNAVWQELWALRQRLRQLLERRGLNADEAFDYLGELQRASQHSTWHLDWDG